MARLKSIERQEAKERAKSLVITATVGDLVGAGMQLPYSDKPSPLDLLAAQPMSPKQSYKLSKIIKAVGAELELYNAEKLKLAEKHGKLNAETQNYDFEPDAMKLFQEEHRELLPIEVTIPGERISLEELGNIQISAGDILRLHWLLQEPD